MCILSKLGQTEPSAGLHLHPTVVWTARGMKQIDCVSIDLSVSAINGMASPAPAPAPLLMKCYFCVFVLCVPCARIMTSLILGVMTRTRARDVTEQGARRRQAHLRRHSVVACMLCSSCKWLRTEQDVSLCLHDRTETAISVRSDD